MSTSAAPEDRSPDRGAGALVAIAMLSLVLGVAATMLAALPSVLPLGILGALVALGFAIRRSPASAARWVGRTGGVLLGLGAATVLVVIATVSSAMWGREGWGALLVGIVGTVVAGLGVVLLVVAGVVRLVTGSRSRPPAAEARP